MPADLLEAIGWTRALYAFCKADRARLLGGMKGAQNLHILTPSRRMRSAVLERAMSYRILRSEVGRRRYPPSRA